VSDVETESVRDRLAEELDGDLHGLTVTRRQGETVYCVAVRSTSWDAVDADRPSIPILDARTVVVDFETDAVRVSDNGLWVPQEGEVATSLTSLLARASNDLGDGCDPDADPVYKSASEDVDVDLFLDREVEVPREGVDGQHVEQMERHTGIDPSREWGYGAGPPPEVETVVDRLTEAGLDPSEHVTRLVWGKKEPMDRTPRPVEELTGNYGIELLPRESGLVAIDVDYPEHFPDSELPETFEVSSPHGDDTQRHIILRCDEKERLAEELGAWAVQRADWGDLWVGDRYLVGPGSQLSEYGCDDGDHERSEPGGCEACEDVDGGYYEVLTDAPIATVEADVILDLLDDSTGYETRDRAPEAPNPEDAIEVEDGDDVVECDSCGETFREEEAEEALKELPVGGSTRRICRGGCE
jgi:hypothetical protein